ncbi:hypothetical protein F4780DRAFT_795061 [Xylariomycetidae sp. FL0641]|nr:hypothetical protein F4780DRAFT_795061 [Xylariomycetidae sp. FL0641]
MDALLEDHAPQPVHDWDDLVGFSGINFDNTSVDEDFTSSWLAPTTTDDDVHETVQADVEADRVATDASLELASYIGGSTTLNPRLLDSYTEAAEDPHVIPPQAHANSIAYDRNAAGLGSTLLPPNLVPGTIPGGTYVPPLQIYQDNTAARYGALSYTGMHNIMAPIPEDAQPDLLALPPVQVNGSVYGNATIDYMMLPGSYTQPDPRIPQPQPVGVQHSYAGYQLRNPSAVSTSSSLSSRRSLGSRLGSRPPTPKVKASASDGSPLKRVGDATGKKLENGKIPRKTRRGMPDIDPSDFYGAPPTRPADWGPLDKRGKRLFRYNKEGELEPGKYFTKKEMRWYLFGPRPDEKEKFSLPERLKGVPVVENKIRQGLTLWIGYPANMANGRYPRGGESTKCRFMNCPDRHHTIGAGLPWVIFDERMNEKGEVVNPFHNAGYVHLSCLEENFDLISLWKRLDVRVDEREFKREQYAYFKLERTQPGIKTEVVDVWYRREAALYQEAREAENPEGRDRIGEYGEHSLATQIIRFRDEQRPNGQKRARTNRGGIDSSKHHGDLRMKATLRCYKHAGLLDANGDPVPDAEERLHEVIRTSRKRKVADPAVDMGLDMTQACVPSYLPPAPFFDQVQPVGVPEWASMVPAGNNYAPAYYTPGQGTQALYDMPVPMATTQNLGPGEDPEVAAEAERLMAMFQAEASMAVTGQAEASMAVIGQAEASMDVTGQVNVDEIDEFYSDVAIKADAQSNAKQEVSVPQIVELPPTPVAEVPLVSASEPEPKPVSSLPAAEPQVKEEQKSAVEEPEPVIDSHRAESHSPRGSDASLFGSLDAASVSAPSSPRNLKRGRDEDEDEELALKKVKGEFDGEVRSLKDIAPARDSSPRSPTSVRSLKRKSIDEVSSAGFHDGGEDLDPSTWDCTWMKTEEAEEAVLVGDSPPVSPKTVPTAKGK